MKPPHERPMRPNATLYSPAARGKLPSPEWEGQTKNLEFPWFGRHPESRILDLPRGCHESSDLHARVQG